MAGGLPRTRLCIVYTVIVRILHVCTIQFNLYIRIRKKLAVCEFSQRMTLIVRTYVNICSD